MSQYKKELDHEKRITAIMYIVCPDYRLIRWKIEKLLQHDYPIEKIVKIFKKYCKKEQILKFDTSICAGAKKTTNKGEWIIRTDNDPICRPWYNTCKCSKCGQYGTKVWNYCPNCGADMRQNYKGEKE